MKTQTVKVKLNKHYISEMTFPNSDGRKKLVKVYHICPLLSDWQAKLIPDGVNPRSHDVECLKSDVARKIEATLREQPEDFVFANRGGVILADGVHYDPKEEILEIKLNDLENQGMADGATTDAVLAKIQKIATEEQGINLSQGRIHFEVIVGLEDRDRIGAIVGGRNTSRQVKPWSMSDFQGTFDWIKEIIENSEFKGKVGYEENSGKLVTILDIVSLITGFHPEFDDETDGEQKAPTIAYSGKGRMDLRLKDPDLLPGYKSLSPVIVDILKLHDHVYVGFAKAYDKVYGPKSKLGKRNGVESKLLDDPHILPLTGTKSDYVIPNGYIFPLLFSLRVLLSHNKASEAKWKTNPFAFFDNHSPKLVRSLMDQADEWGSPAIFGKKKTIYIAVSQKAQVLLGKH